MEWSKLVPELTVFDFKKSLEFYTEILGFKLMFTRENFAYLDQEGVQIMLEQFHQDGWNTGTLETSGARAFLMRYDSSCQNCTTST